MVTCQKCNHYDYELVKLMFQTLKKRSQALVTSVNPSACKVFPAWLTSLLKNFYCMVQLTSGEQSPTGCKCMYVMLFQLTKYIYDHTGLNNHKFQHYYNTDVIIPLQSIPL